MRKPRVAIGIDLGTSKCCVGVVRDGKVEILENERGNKTTPSYVAFTDTERLIGEDAKDQATLNPANTVYGVKRLLGRGFEDPAVQDIAPRLPFKLKRTEQGKPFLELNYMKQIRQLYPEQVTAMLLTKMVDLVKKQLDCSVVEEAVISVPASFSNVQRQATKDAAEIAGLKVLALINEPTAAAIAYQANRKELQEETEIIAIVDFGGGKIEVSFVHVGKGAVKVMAVYGCNRIGGLDVDNDLVELLTNKFKQERIIDLEHNVKAKERLRNACEKLKHTLSLLPEARVQLDCLVGDVDFEATVTRNEFDEVLKHNFVTRINKLKRRIKWLTVTRVLLVGGSTRIPVVQEWIKKTFASIKLDKTVNPDEAVAHGAAIWAAMLSSRCDVPEVNVYDIIPNPLYLDVDNTSEILFERFTAIPNKFVRRLSALSSKSVLTLVELQSSLNGAREIALGDFLLRDRSLYSIEIDCHIDISGILVASLDLNGKKESLDVLILNTLRLLNIKQHSELLVQEKQFRKNALDENKRVMALSELEAYCFHQKSSLETLGKQGKLSQSKLRHLEKHIEAAISWVDNNPDASESVLDQKMLNLQAVFSSLSRNFKEHSSRSSSVGHHLLSAEPSKGVSQERESRWDQSRSGHDTPRAPVVSQSARRSRQGLSEDEHAVDDTGSTNGREALSRERERDLHTKGESPQRRRRAENQLANNMCPKEQPLQKQTSEQSQGESPRKQTSKEINSRLGSLPGRPPPHLRNSSPLLQPESSMVMQPQSQNSHQFGDTASLQPDDQVGLLPLSSTIIKGVTENHSKQRKSNFSPSIKQPLLKTKEKLTSGLSGPPSRHQSGTDNKLPVQGVDARASSTTSASGSRLQSGEQDWANSQPRSSSYQVIPASLAQPYVRHSTDLVTSVPVVVSIHATNPSNYGDSPSDYSSVYQQRYIPRNNVNRSGPLRSTHFSSTSSSSASSSSATSQLIATVVSPPTTPLESDTSSGLRNSRDKQPEARSIGVQTDPSNKEENTSRPNTSKTCEVCCEVFRCACPPAYDLRDNLGRSVMKESNSVMKGNGPGSVHERSGRASLAALTTVPPPQNSTSLPYREDGNGRPTNVKVLTPASSLYTAPSTMTTHFSMGSATPHYASSMSTPITRSSQSTYYPSSAVPATRAVTNPSHFSPNPSSNSSRRGNVPVNAGAGQACKCRQVSCHNCYSSSNFRTSEASPALSVITARNSKIQDLMRKFESTPV